MAAAPEAGHRRQWRRLSHRRHWHGPSRRSPPPVPTAFCRQRRRPLALRPRQQRAARRRQGL
eukprot:28642-Lingulodinium_polyedra.AAC.1